MIHARHILLGLTLYALPHQAFAVEAKDVLKTYGDIAQGMYEDAHSAAMDLERAVDMLIADPSADSLKAARDAWKASRPWYSHTEVYRFGNKVVDDWEGNVNAWPLDEGLIDYVDQKSYGTKSEDNPLFTANVIAHPSLRLGREKVDAKTITPELLRDKLNGAMGSEANVATGYHAIEFLLWGQDLHGTEAGAGERPWTDYSLKRCTHGNCARRAAYLKAATTLLVSDLRDMAQWWAPGGKARQELEAKPEAEGLGSILTGIGSLSYGEMAGERMKLGLLLHDPEEEHDCFSDTTHMSYYHVVAGITAVWQGRYTRRDGSLVSGPAIRDLAKEKSADLTGAVDQAMAETLERFAAIRDTAEHGAMRYDQMIGADNQRGNALVEGGIAALIAQTRAVEAVVAGLGLKITVEGSDSLDNPSAVQK